MRKYKNIVFCTADPTKNAGNIKKYFIENASNLVAFHFFPNFTTENTYYEKFQNGKKTDRKEFKFYKGRNRYLKIIFDYIYFAFVLFFVAENKSYILLNAPIFCIFNEFFSIIKLHRYVLWIGDYYPSHKFPMGLYHAMVNYFNKNLDYVLYLSPPIERIYSRKRAGGKYKDLVWLGIMKEYSRSKRLVKDKITKVGFIGMIRNQQGLDLFFKYLTSADNCHLDVVGDGYLLEHYKKLSKKLGVQNKVTFLGRQDDISQIFSKWDIGIALYENKKDNLSKYCEPTKIKDYLSFSLPVITTKTTYFSKEISASCAGIVIEEDITSLSNAINEIMEHYNQYLEGVNKLITKYDYNKLYDIKFSFMSI